MGLGGHAGPLLPFPEPPDLLVGCNEFLMNVNAPRPQSVLQTDQGGVQGSPDWLGYTNFPSSPHSDHVKRGPAPGSI